MNGFKPAVFALAAAAGALVCAPASATPMWQQNLSFSEQNQSMWSSGSAYQPNYNQFFGTSWTNRSTTVGGFIGGVSTIKTQTASSVAAIAKWYACEGATLGLGNCGSKPAPQYNYSTIDTRTGLKVSATTSGKVGFTVGFTMNSGSVNSSPSYTPQIHNLPTTLTPGQLVRLNTSGGSAMTSGTLSSQFPSVTASLSTTVQLSADVNAQACLTGSCGTYGFNTGTLGGTQQLVSFNNGGITWFGGSGPLYTAVSTAANAAGHPLPTGLPATFDIPAPGGISSLGQVTVDYPQPDVSGTLNPAGTSITGSASSQAIQATLNLPNLIAAAFDSPVGFNGSKDFGHGFSLDYNLIGVSTGPTIGLKQTFDLTPTLYANLMFSQPVNVTGYGLVTQVDGLDWNSLPSMIFGSGTTTITPTFYLGTNLGNVFSMNAAELDNQLALALGGIFTVDGPSFTFNTPLAISNSNLGITNGSVSVGLGTLFNQPFNFFTTPPIFTADFPLGGFSPISAPSFAISTATLPGGGGPTTVPDPGTPALLVAGFLALATLRRRMPVARAG